MIRAQGLVSRVWVRAIKKNYLGPSLSPIFFAGDSYSRTLACCGCLTSDQTVFNYTAHIKKTNAKLHSFTLRSKIPEK